MKKIMAAIPERKQLLFLVMWAVTGILYLPAYKAGFIADFEGLLAYSRDHAFAAFVNSEGFNVKSLYQVTQFQLYIWIHLFGRQPIPWFILLTGLHALNGTLIFRFFERLFADFRLPAARQVALAGALLFLLNPNITEITIWKGGYHYLTGVLMQVLILDWCRSFLVTGRNRFAFWAVLLFFISSFSLEMFYLTPWFCGMLVLGYSWKGLIPQPAGRKALVRIILPQLLLFLLHLLIVKMRFGTWLPHYGTTNEFFFLPGNLFPSVGKYLLTLVCMTAQMPYDYYKGVYGFLSQPYGYYTFTALCALLLLLILFRFKKASPGFQVSAFLFGMFLFSMVITVPIYFDDVMQLYNSRRCYVPAIPVYLLVAVSLFRLIRSPRLAWIVCGAYLLLGVGLTFRKVVQWRTAEKIQSGMLRHYKWQDADTVLLLNLPSYYKDIRIIPADTENSFRENLMVFDYPMPKGVIYSVSSYNMNQFWDGAHVTVPDSNTLKITLNQWGSWWMFNSLGATNYENELYRFEVTDAGHEYLLHLKRRPKGLVILFQQGDQWRQVDLNKKPEEEQW